MKTISAINSEMEYLFNGENNPKPLDALFVCEYGLAVVTWFIARPLILVIARIVRVI